MVVNATRGQVVTKQARKSRGLGNRASPKTAPRFPADCFLGLGFVVVFAVAAFVCAVLNFVQEKVYGSGSCLKFSVVNPITATGEDRDRARASLDFRDPSSVCSARSGIVEQTRVACCCPEHLRHRKIKTARRDLRPCIFAEVRDFKPDLKKV